MHGDAEFREWAARLASGARSFVAAGLALDRAQAVLGMWAAVLALADTVPLAHPLVAGRGISMWHGMGAGGEYEEDSRRDVAQHATVIAGTVSEQ